jgi:uncharacterized protein
MDRQAYTVLNNEVNQQFELTLEGEKATMVYRWYKHKLALMHTAVPEKLEGKGIAGALAEYAFDFAEKNKVQILVYCPFVASYLNRHPQFNHLISTTSDE